MTARKWMLAGASVVALATLGGCASDPYYYDNAYYDGYTTRDYAYRDYAYREAPYTYYSYGPGYYVAPPSVSLGFSYGYHRWR